MMRIYNHYHTNIVRHHFKFLLLSCNGLDLSFCIIIRPSLYLTLIDESELSAHIIILLYT